MAADQAGALEFGEHGVQELQRDVLLVGQSGRGDRADDRAAGRVGGQLGQGA
jgi:hypothetical protein